MAGSSVQYRPLTADLRGATEAFAARIPQEDRGFADAFLFYQVAVASWTQATPARRIVAMVGDDIVGVVSVIPQGGWQSHIGEFRIVVQPDQRHLGMGRGLIERGLALAQELGLLKVMIEIMASNTRGLALFERYGFTREALLVNHVRDGDGDLQDLVLMSRQLAPAAA